MAINQKRRQKKLMKKRQKDKARKKNLTSSGPFTSLSIKKKILTARSLPVYECLVNPSWQEKGLAIVTVSRRQPDGNLLFGVYLVDVFCLGLKNTFCNADFSVWRYATEFHSRIYRDEDPVECPISLAHHIIYGAIEFAEQFGFKPHGDFKLSQFVLEDRNNIELCEDIEFGKDGQPFYIAGPDDNVEHIMKQLESTAGKENFNFLYCSDELPFHERQLNN
ncbi:MAG: hypothetical protein ABIG61_06495 [Planctomycetota bacterium]